MANVIVIQGRTWASGIQDGVVDLVPIAMIRGDCNGDVSFDIGDSIFFLNFLFTDGVSTTCEDACDVNDDGHLDIGDPIFGLSALFSGGPQPSAPFPECGPDPTADDMGCEIPPTCP